MQIESSIPFWHANYDVIEACFKSNGCQIPREHAQPYCSVLPWQSPLRPVMLLVLQGSPVEAGATITVKKGRWRQKMCGLASHYLVKASSLQQESKKSMNALSSGYVGYWLLVCLTKHRALTLKRGSFVTSTPFCPLLPPSWSALKLSEMPARPVIGTVHCWPLGDGATLSRDGRSPCPLWFFCAQCWDQHPFSSSLLNTQQIVDVSQDSKFS